MAFMTGVTIGAGGENIMAHVDLSMFDLFPEEVEEDKYEYLYNNAHRLMQRHIYQKNLEHNGLMGYFA